MPKFALNASGRRSQAWSTRTWLVVRLGCDVRAELFEPFDAGLTGTTVVVLAQVLNDRLVLPSARPRMLFQAFLDRHPDHVRAKDQGNDRCKAQTDRDRCFAELEVVCEDVGPVEGDLFRVLPPVIK